MKTRSRREFIAITGAAAAGVLAAVLALDFTSGMRVAAQELNTGPGPDMILYNGKISTVDANNTVVEAIALRGGIVLQTGTNREIRRLAMQNTRSVDLRGRRVLPGLIDGHLHGLREGYHCWTQGVRLDLVSRRADALAMYKAKADELEDGRWIWTTGGWTIRQLDDSRPFTLAELNAAAPNNPMWLAGMGMGARVNQAALNLLTWTAKSPGVEVVDGQITGELTGPALEAANAAILAQLGQLGIDGEAQCLVSLFREIASHGMTSFKDATGNSAPWSNKGSINQGLHHEEPVRELYRSQGFLTARVAYNGMASAYDGMGYERYMAAADTHDGFAGDDYLRYLGPGEDMMATMPNYPEFAEWAARKRLSVETHVGGDIDKILDGMEAGNKVYPIAKLKWRIVHPGGGLPTDVQLARAKTLGVGWVPTVGTFQRGGPGPRVRSMMLNSAHFCLASDAMNAGPWPPFQGLWYVITGKTMIPGVEGLAADQRLNRLEALRARTSECAWFMDQDGRLGTLERGKHADLIVLTDDYFTVPEDAIKDLRSVLTIVGGRIVWAAGEFAELAPAARR